MSKSFPPRNPPKLLEQVRARIRRLGFSKRTEYAYVGWIRRFILANGKRHPREMGKREVERFLTQLAVQQRVAPSTQNQAMAALLFLYKEVFYLEVPWLLEVTRAKKRETLPIVLSRREVNALLGELNGVYWLMASLIYASGIRLMECLRIRVKDLGFDRCELIVRQGKGGKDRQTLFPESLHSAMRVQLAAAKRVHESDLAAGYGQVWLPDALERKYANAAREWEWQYVFLLRIEVKIPAAAEFRGTIKTSPHYSVR